MMTSTRPTEPPPIQMPLAKKDEDRRNMGCLSFLMAIRLPLFPERHYDLGGGVAMGCNPTVGDDGVLSRTAPHDGGENSSWPSRKPRKASATRVWEAAARTKASGYNFFSLVTFSLWLGGGVIEFLIAPFCVPDYSRSMGGSPQPPIEANVLDLSWRAPPLGRWLLEEIALSVLNWKGAKSGVASSCGHEILPSCPMVSRWFTLASRILQGFTRKAGIGGGVIPHII